MQGVQVADERTPVRRVPEPPSRRQVVDQQQVLPVRVVGTRALPADVAHRTIAGDVRRPTVRSGHRGVKGPHKGGGAEGFQVVADSPRLEDIWQSHRPLDTDPAYRTADELTANLTDEDCCHSLLVP